MKKLFIFLTLTLYIVQSLQAGDAADDKVDIQQLNQLFGTNYNGDIYSGYLPANTDGTVQFHYLFYPSQDSPDEKPVILWLHGGPGCSSLISAFTEQGPFTFKEDSIEFEENKNSWIEFANLLYIESPISAGFSYGPAQQQSDESTAIYNIYALVQFFARFQNFKSQKLYIGGLSYGGIYVPTLTKQILNYNQNPTNVDVLKINLQGIIIVNGCTDSTECTVAGSYFPIHKLSFFGRHGFISETTYTQIIAKSQECFGKQDVECANLKKEAYSQIFGENNEVTINRFNIYGKCFKFTSNENQKSIFDLNIKADEDEILECTDVKGLYHWLQNDQTRTILKIRQESNKWVECANQNFEDYQINPNGSYDIYTDIIKNNIRVLKISGDVDAVVPITGTMYWINKLQEELSLQTLKSWRPWFVEGTRKDIDSDQVAGFVIDIEGLTFVSVRNAGHFVTSDQRYESTVVVKKFLRQEYL